MAPDGASTPPVDSAVLRMAQMRQVARHVPIALLGLIGNALVLVYVLWGVAPNADLLRWVWVLLALTAARLGLHLYLYRNSESPQSARRWMWSYYAGTMLSGFVWGGIGLVLPGVDGVYAVFAAFLTGGLAAASVASYGAVPGLSQAFVVPATGCIALAMAMRGDRTSLVMAGMIVVFGVLLSLIGHGVYRTTLREMKLRAQNDGLVSFLTEAKTAAERLNEELKQEIGEREQAERSLRESEERFRTLVESALDGIGFIFEGRIHYANQSALDLFGFEADEVLGMPIDQFVEAAMFERDTMLQRYQDRIDGKDVPSQYEAQIVRKDGTVVDVLFSNSFVTLNGNPGVMSIMKDITERKKAEHDLRVAKETAEEATRLKDQFVSLLAHDLRAPLNSVFSLVQLLGGDSGNVPAEEKRQILQTVTSQGQTTLRMIEDLLSVSRLRAGTAGPKLRFVDASSISTQAITLVRAMAAEKHVELIDDVPRQTRLYTDPEMFGKVIYNLLVNAVKFGSPGERIRVFVPLGRPTTVAISDQGPGVDARLLPNLFRHEVKTTSLGSAGERGMGLGLPLSQDLMESLGGELSVESEPGKGATFYATLPAVRPKILVVGQDEALGALMRPHLNAIEADCMVADNEETALALLDRESPHVVVAEAPLDRNGGTALLQRIRKAPHGHDVPLIVVADDAGRDQVEQGVRLGVDEIVTKPLVPNEFVVRLRRFIN